MEASPSSGVCTVPVKRVCADPDPLSVSDTTDSVTGRYVRRSLDQLISSCINSEGLMVAHQRRRVNPESLALRLGPDLVRDLDALILPGNIDMPSFAVRKELQERYNIDRRHIYDYFHSKGLRVVKEDKNGNPIVQKDLTPQFSQPNLRPLRQAPSKDSNPPRQYSYNLPSTKRNLPKTRGVAKAKPGRPRKVVNNEKTKLDYMPSLTANSDIPTSQRAYSACSSNAEDFGDSDFIPLATLSDDAFPFGYSTNDISFPNWGEPMLKSTDEIRGSGGNHLPCLFDFSSDLTSGYTPSPLMSLGYGSLTEKERTECYSFLDRMLGPACGIQESVCTYKSYMMEQRKLYYRRLLATPRSTAREAAQKKHAQEIQASTRAQPRHAEDNEFGSWVYSGTLFDKTEKACHLKGVLPCKSSSQSCAASTITQKTSSEDTMSGIDSDADRDQDHSEASENCTLDDLFPSPMDHIIRVNVNESPVVRSKRDTFPPMIFMWQDSSEDEEGPLAMTPSDHPVTAGSPAPTNKGQLSAQVRGKHLPARKLRFGPSLASSLHTATSRDTMLSSCLVGQSTHVKTPTPQTATPSTPPTLPSDMIDKVCPSRMATKSCLRALEFAAIDCGRIRKRSVTSRSVRLRTASAGGGI